MDKIDQRIHELSNKLSLKFSNEKLHTSLVLELMDINEKLKQNRTELEAAYAKAEASLTELNKIKPPTSSKTYVTDHEGRKKQQKSSDEQQDPLETLIFWGKNSEQKNRSEDKSKSHEDPIDSRFYDYLKETKRILSSFEGKLTKSDIPVSHFFENSKYGPARILHPNLGISRCVVMLSTLISAVALEEPDESSAENATASQLEKQIQQWSVWKQRTIEMIIEYYVCVAPILFKDATDTNRYENDCIFLEHILRHIHLDNINKR